MLRTEHDIRPGVNRFGTNIPYFEGAKQQLPIIFAKAQK
jgi:hypothetical protein